MANTDTSHGLTSAPIKLVDNGDGTYSLAVSVSGLEISSVTLTDVGISQESGKNVVSFGGSPQPVSITGSLANLLSNATATGSGTPVAVNSYKNYIFEVWGTATSFDIKVQVVGPSGTPRNMKIWDELNNAFLPGDIITVGIYSVSVPPQMSIQANVISIVGGNVNLEGGLMF